MNFLIQQLNKLRVGTSTISSYFSTKTNMTDNPIVQISEGKVKGAVKSLLDGSSYYSFKGIPYGQPPIGNLRFKAPLPAQSWSHTLEALDHGPVCPQYDMTSMMFVEGNENCLHLNVYSKTLQTDSKRPVIVFIHGGGFMSGSGNDDMYGPESLVQHDIVLVTLNYRLEVLGFLSLDHPEVPGNAGMKDQVLGLKWVQRNISQFGGDPDNVTIYGESAGAASVTLHMLSPMSKGLFHKAVAHSGTCLADWGMGIDSLERAFRLVKHLGKDTTDKNECLDYLRSLPAIKLAKVSTKTATPDETQRALMLHFVPVVEKTFEGVEAFLSEEPLDLILANKVNKVPFMIGYNSMEACGMVQPRAKDIDTTNNESQYLVMRELAYKITEEKTKEFGERIKRFYAGDRDFKEDDLQALCDLESDRLFVLNSQRFTNMCAMYNKDIFMFKFNCDTELNFIKRMLGVTDWKGASHADDLFYLFSNNMNKDILSDNIEVRDLVFRVTKLWADFARTGNPTPKPSKIIWKPFTVANKEYLTIDQNFTNAQHADRERMEFWNQLYSEAGLPSITKSNL